MKKNALKKILIISLLSGFFFIACKKNIASRSSSEKEIYNFGFALPSGYASGYISNDSIMVRIPPGVVLAPLAPDIQYTGASIYPAIGELVDFRAPVTYTVTAEDGSTRSYVVLVSNISTTKEILDFRFTSSQNPGISSDAIGEFINDSSIVVRVPGGVNLQTFRPTITHNGMDINPSGSQPTDFSRMVYYTVTAEDMSTRKYNVMVTSNNRVFVGCSNGYVYALDAVNGQQVWSFNGGNAMGSPVFAGGKIYVAAQGGSVFCLNADNGSVIWSFANMVTNYTTPCVYNGKLFIGYNRTAPYGDGLYALDAAGGNLLWTHPIMNGIGYGGIATPTAVDDKVVLTEFNIGIRVLDAATGTATWSYNPGIVMSNPLVKDGVVYTGTESSLISAYNLSNGSLIWTNNTYPNTIGSPVMANDVIYVAGGFYMYAINKLNGGIIWQQQSWGGYYGIGSGSQYAGRFSAPFVSLVDTALFAGNNDDLTYSLNLTTGAKNWNYTNTLQVKNTTPNPVAAHGMMFTGREDNSLYAFAARNGTLIWKFTAPGAINTDPCLTDKSGNVFYVGNSGNNN